VKAGWIVASAVDGAAVVIGHLPAGLEPGKLGQFRSTVKRKPTVNRWACHAMPPTSERQSTEGDPRNAPDRRIFARMLARAVSVAYAQNVRLCLPFPAVYRLLGLIT
jgi:hypothetical protein